MRLEKGTVLGWQDMGVMEASLKDDLPAKSAGKEGSPGGGRELYHRHRGQPLLRLCGWEQVAGNGWG